ncbi:MAG: GNAT family N-acetyltransferase [Eubacteriales bacterium]
MELRKSAADDINAIMKIIEQAQANFKKAGIDQWQDGYPNRETVLKDIDNEESYVLIKNGEIAATGVVSFQKEEAYTQIYEGQWLSGGGYDVIHRVAVAQKYQGRQLSSAFMELAERLCRERGLRSVRADTHEQNLPMQTVLKNNGFQYCGIVYLKSGAKRLAFEKVI